MTTDAPAVAMKDDEATVERVARAMVKPLGYTQQAADNWGGVWVGSNVDTPETGSLEYLCTQLARAALAALPTPQTEALAWQDVSTAPAACHVLATRFEDCSGEWITCVVASPPINPFTHWRPLPAPPALRAGGQHD